MKIVYRASNISEAHIVCGMLRANGIECSVGGHYLQGGVGELPPMGFALVHVVDEDFLLARKLIAEYEGKKQTAPVDSEKPYSDRLAIISKLSVFLLVVLIAILILLFFR